MECKCLSKWDITAITSLRPTVEFTQVILRGTLERVWNQLDFESPSHHLPHGRLWKYKLACITVKSMSCRILIAEKTFFNCETILTTIAICLLHGFIPDETQRLPSSARTYPFAQEHKTSFCTLFLMLQKCSQSPLFILQYFGMTIKEVSSEKNLLINSDFTEDLKVHQIKPHSLNRICISTCKLEACLSNNEWLTIAYALQSSHIHRMKQSCQVRVGPVAMSW